MRHRSARERRAFFFFNDTASTDIYTLSLHDALPICRKSGPCACSSSGGVMPVFTEMMRIRLARAAKRSEEHTSELQSHVNLVCRLLLEKKKNNIASSSA